MTQRIFDANNPEDVKELFGLLPDDCFSIEKTEGENGFPNKVSMVFDMRSLGIWHALKIEWHDLTEIKRPVDYSKWIGKLGWFWDFAHEERIGKLIEVGIHGYSSGTFSRKKFRPLTLEEAKQLIAED